MEQDFLSDIELYYSPEISAEKIDVGGEEFHHIIDVMRNGIGDIIYISDGRGKIYKSEIISLSKKYLSARILDCIEYENEFSNFTFCVPRLKNSDRFEFAVEKCIELGITNFIVYESEHSVAKGGKLERWQKIALSAMKQSLRAWLPNMVYLKSLREIVNFDGVKIFFDQKASRSLSELIISDYLNFQAAINTFFIFGPEGGFSSSEFELIQKENLVKLTGNRLRSETAVISAASVVSQFLMKNKA